VHGCRDEKVLVLNPLYPALSFHEGGQLPSSLSEFPRLSLEALQIFREVSPISLRECTLPSVPLGGSTGPEFCAGSRPVSSLKFLASAQLLPPSFGRSWTCALDFSFAPPSEY